VYPNGQATYRETEMAAHIDKAAPWRAAATTSREYSSTDQGGVPANRFYEFGNTGPGAP
jgi:pectin methylesterase-like acyl-CoA thioesterase